VTDRPAPWKAEGVLKYLEELAAARPNAADYAVTVRNLHDRLVEDIGDAAWVRQFLLLQVSFQQDRGLISKQHRGFVAKLLPKLVRRGRGRPKGALGDNAYDRRYRLYSDWIGEKALDPSLTKEQFAKQHLGITDKDLEGEYGSDHRTRMDALLQELKPARMKQLDEGQRRALEILYPTVITWDREFARQWREAKQRSPRLTKEKFIENFFKWPRKRKRHPFEAEAIREFLERLGTGEKQLADSERVSDRDQSARPATANSKRKPAR
jgi:hypothetical protein